MDLDRPIRGQETAETNEQCAHRLVILSLNLPLRVRPPLSKSIHASSDQDQCIRSAFQ
jgi:hypothetical protein